MSRNHIVLNLLTGQQSVVPYTVDEEAAADAANAADVAAQAPVMADAARVAAIRANARRQALIAAIMQTDDAGILTYINNNVTDLASAKVMLANIALLVAGVIRS